MQIGIQNFFLFPVNWNIFYDFPCILFWFIQHKYLNFSIRKEREREREIAIVTFTYKVKSIINASFTITEVVYEVYVHIKY